MMKKRSRILKKLLILALTGLSWLFGSDGGAAPALGASYECDPSTVSSSWNALSQYNVTKYEYYNAEGDVLESMAGKNGVFTYNEGKSEEKVGSWIPTIRGIHLKAGSSKGGTPIGSSLFKPHRGVPVM